MPRILIRPAFVRCSIVLFVSAAACYEPALAPTGGGSMTEELVITPGQIRLAAVGDTMRLHASLYDGDGNPVAGRAVAWTSADPSVFTIDQNGLVTGKQGLSVGRAIASANGLADTAYVMVANPGASPCLGSSAPVALAIGQSLDVSMSDGACITSAGGGDEYLVMPWYGTSKGSSTIPLDVMGIGLAATTTSPSRIPLASRIVGTAPIRRDLMFDRRMRELGERVVMPMASHARAAIRQRALSPNLSSVPTYLSVGDLVQLNTNTDPCASPVSTTGRVIVTSARAIIVADTSNPPGGFSSADYARISVTYDTLVAAVEDAAFGAPTDLDANGKVILFFTRALNALTPSGTTSVVSGFFHPRDLLPRIYNGELYCAASNEREMIYMPVPDPNGAVNGNAFSVGFIDSLTIGTLAHENQHLVNFGRRLYVNDAFADEEVWLNEGLSDIAQELVFYRAAGLAPRQNIGAEHFGTQPFDGLFSMYMAPNLSRLAVFLQQPQSYSPFSSSDQTGTYGAAWSFLRYAADHRGSADGDVWLRLVNSQVAGFDNLASVFGPNLGQMLNAWSLSLYTDDATPGVDSMYVEPSWNLRSAYPAFAGSAQPYPLLGAVGVLSDGQSQSVSLNGGGSAYYRFSITSGGSAVIRVTTKGLMPPGAVQATIVRTR
ncbi:MAG: Ig domain-containing protein [Gemmatimonadaceae bacterium]